MKIQLNKVVKPNKFLKQSSELKVKQVKSNKSEVLKEINAVKLNFEDKAEYLTSQEYLLARKYLANAEMEQLYKIYEKEL